MFRINNLLLTLDSDRKYRGKQSNQRNTHYWQYESTEYALLTILINGIHITNNINQRNTHYWQCESTEYTLLTIKINGIHITDNMNQRNAHQ